jgi:hypothetical protein
MPSTPSTPAPEATTLEIVTLDELIDPTVRRGVARWRQLCGTRAFPSREDIRPRDCAGLLRNMMLVRVIDHGADFELRIVGDEISRAYPAPLNGRLLSDVAAELPLVGHGWGNMFRVVVGTRLPIAIRVRVGLNAPDVRFSMSEAACLPLGPSDDTVDHLMSIGAHTLRTV